MNLFTRLSELVNVNVHALLDRAEDPERMLAHVLRTMEEGLDASRQQAARAIAAERGLGRELDQHRAAAEGWTRRSLRAVHLGRDDLARRALAHKIEHDDVIADLSIQHAAAQRLSDDVKTAYRALERRLAECRRRHKLLVARKHAAQVRLDVIGVLEASPSFTRFDQIARRLTDLEDQVLAQAELDREDRTLERQLDELEMARRIDDELATLKGEPGA